MTTLQNTALWLTKKRAAFEVRSAPYTQPAADEIVVRALAVAVNPFDRYLQSVGNLVCPWLRYPAVVGTDVAGEVVATGSAATRFAPGDRVVGHAAGIDKERNRAAEGAFQNYVVLLEHMTSPIPANITCEQACVLPLAISTAACALFQDDFLGLRAPTLAPNPTGETVVVWGGSTSVGANAIQLARAAGYDVLTTCSPANFGFVRSLGARMALDYRSPSIVADLVGALHGTRCAGAVAICVGSTQPCIDLVAAAAGQQTVAVVTPPATFDSVPAGRGHLRHLIPVLMKNGGGMLANQARARNRRVKAPFVWGGALIHNAVGPMIFKDYLPEALSTGKYQIAPAPRVVGHGLEAVPLALAAHAKGVSAAKLVVTL